MSEYEGREQSLVKHYILRKYLLPFALILGRSYRDIAYVDCFSGPWQSQKDDLSDTSFAIALAVLREAQAELAKQGLSPRIRCFFLESEAHAYRQLEEFASEVVDAVVATKHARLAQAVPDILKFMEQGGSRSFPFLLIDPTGWTGFELDVIEPLISRRPSEVLVNFMTGHIRRFIRSPDQATQASFARTFGRFAPDPAALAGLADADLDDAIVQSYSGLLREAGAFSHVSSAIVLHPEVDRTHFHLIYATRDIKGLEVFKGAERQAMSLQDSTRADLQLRKEPILPLFAPEAVADLHHVDQLKLRYRRKAREAVVSLLQRRDRVQYDALYGAALAYPLVFKGDLDEILLAWRDQGAVQFVGWKPKQRRPKVREHEVVAVRDQSLIK